MRLVRFPRQPTRVSEDIRAALASLGRGRNVVGGVALAGVRPAGAPRAVDAVLIVPGGVLVVVGVDLPDPAMRLDAPLDGQWRTDGWPLVSTDEAVNPGIEALALAATVAERVRAVEPDATLGTVIAVGPFVETVEQPPADLAGPVRVVHPTPTSMLAAAVSLASAERPFTAQQVRALVRAMEPTAPEQDDETLAAEGFTTEENPLALAPETVPIEHPTKPAATPVPVTVAVNPERPRPPRPAPLPSPLPAPAPAPATPPVPAPRPRRPRWQPLAAAGAFVAVIGAVLAIVLTRGGEDEAPAGTPAAVTTAGGVEFTERAAGADDDCAPHATGDLQVALEESGCTGVRRASFDTTVDGATVAVSVAALAFPDEASAQEFLRLADTPGSGTITDLATETERWPGDVPAFANAAYAGALDGSTVRFVLTCLLDGASRPDDPRLTDTAKAALKLPL
ncbi:sensor domain-containing protein [Prauserella endophytica]|uniref:PknH-like extracellular domain-containing protein n=1 Tax=Prauserella endophytica TaxID=1592324 RepID=A0ABY2S7I5_9PSEU|nr:sensor domain-containing protein [Prauserella endophytica]TKG71426.1 hypothetical protein FCN18_11610 [Prauserella endophytica]